MDNHQRARLWPYEEAKRLIERVRAYDASRPIIFESGFGPSGRPHLGTMCEVLRPSYVRLALGLLGEPRLTRLIVFIDDMDGLRKVPENLPNRDAMQQHLGKPVSNIPDPFGCCASFADHMVGLLVGLLAPTEASYELIRASEMYAKGHFDAALRLILARHEQITALIRPTLREENRAGWSPFMPICPRCGQVNSTRVTAYHLERGSVGFSCEREFAGARGCGFAGEQSVLGGSAKVGWKVDWALRWYALKVDYELYGKDLIPSARLSAEIVKMLGGRPPLGFHYELYLDEGGRKISKSVGRGVGVEQWQRYAPIEVLKYFIFLHPKRARRLFLEAIPQYVDEYLEELRAYAVAPAEQVRQSSPLEFVLQKSSVRRFDSDLSYTLIMNLVGALGTSERPLIWSYLRRSDPKLEGDPETRALAESLLQCALNFYADFVEPNKQRYVPAGAEREQLEALRDYLNSHGDASGDEIERAIYDLGRRYYGTPGEIFPLLYRVLLGQERGPRLGAFNRLATPARIAEMLKEALGPAA